MRASIDAARISEDAQALDVLATELGRDLHCRVLFRKTAGRAVTLPVFTEKAEKVAWFLKADRA